jgi:hypothetical protein
LWAVDGETLEADKIDAYLGGIEEDASGRDT